MHAHITCTYQLFNICKIQFFLVEDEMQCGYEEDDPG